MIKEIATAFGGVFSGLAVILVVLFYPSLTNSPNVTSSGLYRSPFTGPIAAPDSLRFSSVTSGLYSGILPGLLLLVLALGAGFLVAYVGVGRLRGEAVS